ncbi:MAG: glycosyltransferase [Thermodesulfovibrionales bacterium]
MNQKPLVSIIVRTKDRPKVLVRAIKSIASQTYRPIEVVLVNDGGCDLDIDDLQGILGDIHLNYQRLEKNTGRAHAGNVGIENAKGEYIGFLDDDDEFYPEHVEILVNCFQGTDYKVAYTAVEFVEKIFDSQSMTFIKEKKWVFGRQFSFDDLLLNNYIPINSLLLEADLLRNFMFDETFELYEDWDLLIRLATVCKFYYVDEITAAYIIGETGQIAYNPPFEEKKKAILKIYSKHREKITAENIFFLNETVHLRDKEIEQAKRELEEVKRERESFIIQNKTLIDTNANLARMNRKMEAYINRIHSSRAWKCLKLLESIFRR